MKKRLNAMLALLSYTVTPDQTASSLGINNGNTCNPALNMTPLGGPVPINRHIDENKNSPNVSGASLGIALSF
ncbi:hypothetical protein PWR63_29485 [Paraburkholderia sp. A2WS-5]|uniref:hypothetical protein n=1 Tax=unclassified Paraburkholderia TaxID=2615204 RepID=UPI003B7DA2BA